MGGIRMSPRHGVNPSLDVCWWCHEPKGVALLGQMKRDPESGEIDPAAPREIVTDYQPCSGCAEHHAQGVVLVEATGQGFDHATGRWWVIKREAAYRLFDARSYDSIMECGGKAFIDPEAAEKAGLLEIEPVTNLDK